MPRYGVKWHDGTFTGGITDHARDAAAYARMNDGIAYAVGSDDDPERAAVSEINPRITLENQK